MFLCSPLLATFAAALAMNPLQDAFISYGRADSKEFAKTLYDHFTAKGYKIWFDAEDIPLGVDYQKQIDDGIAKADNFIYIISPHSVNSPYCALEVELALKFKKRIIPILQVEEIDRQTWQQRNPGGTDADWEAYKAEGKHASFPNLHPALSKINWIYARAEDSLESAYAGLEAIIERQRDYVRQHTQIFAQATLWDANQKQVPDLLQGDALTAAQDWLQTRFKTEQPPCLPTDLHCEYICTSLLQANQGATRVFLSHSEQDLGVTEKIRLALMQSGMPVWTNRTNIRTGADFQQEINRGIERADTLVYLISPHSVTSPYCQQEVAYARQLNKRLIPLLITDMPLGEIPAEQRSLQFINFQQFSASSDPSADPAFQALLQILKRHEAYDQWHRSLLVSALTWDRQERPKGLLLRADQQAIAEHFLQLQAQQAQTEEPELLPLILTQENYITESRERNKFFDAFISYGRADSKAFATALHDRLTQAGYRIWFDQNDIPLGVDFQEQIDDGLEKSDNFIFIIAPHSVNSPYCTKEIELAARRNKRIIPLLHVEEIPYETWLERNPQGTAAQWEEYRAAGKHSSFPNMPAVIGRVNWIYCRDGIDDLDQSFGGLVDLLQRDRDYVHTHTEVLSQALEWERNQHQIRYLLVGDARKAAEDWLQTRFRDQQPPCQPTDLHCDYICESIKNANGFMTQVFIVQAEADREMGDRVRRSLARWGITVWQRPQDMLQVGEFQEMIDRGIEETDTILVLVSPSAVADPRCHHQMGCAYSLRKRIVPILVQPTDLTYIPEDIRHLQFIDMTQGSGAEVYQSAINKVLQALQKDAPYHHQHKMLLTQALKWERQHLNPSILLRGNALKQVENWYQVAKNNLSHGLVPVQEQFLDESRKQPPNQTFNVFISYSRSDSDFARKLNDNLQIQGMITWFDQENIDTGTDFQQEIYKGIENSENFLFIPNSVLSPYAKGEIEYAAKLNKRFVVILYREVPPSSLHPMVANVQWIDFRRRGGDFLSNFGELVRMLASDPEYIQAHTRLLVKANEWDLAGRDDGFLLRGKDLTQASLWLEQAGDHTPQPTDLQKAYIQASKQLPFRRIRARSVAFTTLTATVTVFVVRFLGLTQAAELRAFDSIMRARPAEPQDSRITVVEVDSASTRWLRQEMIGGRYEPGLGTIPDAALAELLDTLLRHSPRLIALDFYRDFEAQPVVADRIANTDELVMVCKAASVDEFGTPVDGYTPPPELEALQWANRVGFSDLSGDGESMIRRHYMLKPVDPEFCPLDEAFSFVLARRFLATEDYVYESPYVRQEGDVYYGKLMKLGHLTIPQLVGIGGGYQYSDGLLYGYQTMVNYRRSKNPEVPDAPATPLNFVSRVSLAAVLTGEKTATELEQLFADRLVLVGFSDRADPSSDFWSTPVGELPGVYVQAQMASQLMSAVLDDRPLIWWWPWTTETGWSGLWGALAALLMWQVSPTNKRILGSAGLVLLLTLICYGAMLTNGAWLPLVPPLVTMALSATGVIWLTQRLRNP